MEREPYNHIKKNDYVCPRCKVLVKIFIPHECDPSICYICNGYGRIWSGESCEECEGTGKTIWKDDDDAAIPA